jgi:hypothetical protein
MAATDLRARLDRMPRYYGKGFNHVEPVANVMSIIGGLAMGNLGLDEAVECLAHTDKADPYFDQQAAEALEAVLTLLSDHSPKEL